MAKLELLCASFLIVLLINMAYSKPDFAVLKPWDIEEDASECTDDFEYCKCMAAKPGRCQNDIEIRGACARSCNACEKKKRNLYLAELNKLRRRFVRQPAVPEKRGCGDNIADCDCMEHMCHLYKDYMRAMCPFTCGYC